MNKQVFEIIFYLPPRLPPPDDLPPPIEPPDDLPPPKSELLGEEIDLGESLLGEEMVLGLSIFGFVLGSEVLPLG